MREELIEKGLETYNKFEVSIMHEMIDGPFESPTIETWIDKYAREYHRVYSQFMNGEGETQKGKCKDFESRILAGDKDLVTEFIKALEEAVAVK